MHALRAHYTSSVHFTLYAMTMTIVVAYKYTIRLHYVAMAYKNFCMPQKTIPPIAIFPVVYGVLRMEIRLGHRRLGVLVVLVGGGCRGKL
jgi:hypothetical protein